MRLPAPAVLLGSLLLLALLSNSVTDAAAKKSPPPAAVSRVLGSTINGTRARASLPPCCCCWLSPHPASLRQSTPLPLPARTHLLPPSGPPPHVHQAVPQALQRVQGDVHHAHLVLLVSHTSTWAIHGPALHAHPSIWANHAAALSAHPP